MNGKQRLLAAIAHQEADRPPIDMGATSVTGMHAGTMSLLRDALGLEHRPVKVHEVFQPVSYTHLLCLPVYVERLLCGYFGR